MRKTLLAITLIGIFVIVILPLLVGKQAKITPKGGFRGVRVMLPSGKTQTMELEEYLVGVLSAEMPAEFEPEALKAQAVAARTYTVRRLVQAGASSIYDVDTTERTQAWISDEEMRKKWGVLKYLSYKRKIERAVKETAGYVLAFEGDYVQAFYFSSAGRLPTEKADDVWGSSLPYLTNIEPEEGELGKFVVKRVFAPAEIDSKLGTKLAKKGRLTSSDVSITEKTTAGRAKTVQIGDIEFPATKVRAQLGLRSTDFIIQIEGKGIAFTTYGNGHAVGMSQYGANLLAKKGKSFGEILEHYYPGAELLNIN